MNLNRKFDCRILANMIFKNIIVNTTTGNKYEIKHPHRGADKNKNYLSNTFKSSTQNNSHEPPPVSSLLKELIHFQPFAAVTLTR